MKAARPTQTIRALLLVAGLAPLLGTSELGAQEPFGEIQGTVEDEGGKPLPGVSVTLSGIGRDRLTETDERGAYRFKYLDPGIYSVTARLDGYTTMELPEVSVGVNRSTTIHFALPRYHGEVLVVAQSPLDPRRVSQGTEISSTELQNLPLTRDYADLVLLEPRAQIPIPNVGGSETSGAPQPIFGPATTPLDNDFLLDGIQITSTTFLSTPLTFLDFDQFDAVEVSTGGPDVTRNTSGVAINMVTRRGTNDFRGSARFFSTKDDGLGFLGGSSSDVDCADLHPDQSCEGFSTNGVKSISEYGFGAGGPAIIDRLWLWGAWSRTGLRQVEATGRETSGDIETTTVKLNAQPGASNAFVASWHNGLKVNRTAAPPDRSPETAWTQHAGPAAFWRFEDSHVFASSLFATGSYQKGDQHFSLTPRSGCLNTSCPLEQETLWDSDGIWRQNYLNGWQRNPEDAFRLDGSYFFNTGSVSHELKFGGRLRQSVNQSNFNWPGRNIVHIAGENFNQAPGPVDFFFLYRGPNALEVEVDHRSVWVQDTLGAGNWTINAGVRWDLQDGTNRPGTTGESALPEILPEVSFSSPVDAGFDWESITPRLGLTYALGQDRNTLLRTSFSRFPSQLGSQDVAWLNPAAPSGSGALAYFLFIDSDGDNQWNGEELYGFIDGNGYDEQNPTANLNTVDPGLDPEVTTEWTLAVEQAILPELVAGITYTGRRVDNVFDRGRSRPIVRPKGSNGPGRPATAADYVPVGTVGATLPDGTSLEVPAFELDESLEDTGFAHRENDARTRDYHGIAITARKRLADNWSLRAYVNWGETEWNVPQSYLDDTDPNPDPEGSDQDGALFVIRDGFRGERYVQSGWQASLAGTVQLAPTRPWSFLLAGNAYARQGHVLPYDARRDPEAGAFETVSLMNGQMDRFRLDDLYLLDLRAEKTFAATGDVNFTFSVDLFNALNSGTVLSRETTLNRLRGSDWVLDIVSPRIWRLGARVSWK